MLIPAVLLLVGAWREALVNLPVSILINLNLNNWMIMFVFFKQIRLVIPHRKSLCQDHKFSLLKQSSRTYLSHHSHPYQTFKITFQTLQY
jgi:hypothetical protein